MAYEAKQTCDEMKPDFVNTNLSKMAHTTGPVLKGPGAPRHIV